MQKKAIFLFVFILILAGCSEKSPLEVEADGSEKQENTILYENVEHGLMIDEVQGWSYTKEVLQPFNVSFTNDQASVIVSILSNEKTVEEMKDEILLGAGDVTIIEEDEDALSYKTNRKESVRTNLYIERTENDTRLLIFMTPFNEYEKNKEKFDRFKSNIHFK